MSKGQLIQVWNRKYKRLEMEQVYGEAWLRLGYDTAIGRKFLGGQGLQQTLSKILGALQDLPMSAKKIPHFVKKYNIDLSLYEQGPFKTFNDFFIRRFKQGARSFEVDPLSLPAIAEGRVLAISVQGETQKIEVKGVELNSAELLGSQEKAQTFKSGPIFIFRLCPVDYHRFHYPDEGEVIERYRIPGSYHSVNPLAFKHQPKTLMQNERVVEMIRCKNLGRLAIVAVGALGVGKIVHHLDVNSSFKRGDEMGYFLFGGSSVVLLCESNNLVCDQDLIEQTKKGIETLVYLGERVAKQF